MQLRLPVVQRFSTDTESLRDLGYRIATFNKLLNGLFFKLLCVSFALAYNTLSLSYILTLLSV